jgi:hypothetical protein
MPKIIKESNLLQTLLNLLWNLAPFKYYFWFGYMETTGPLELDLTKCVDSYNIFFEHQRTTICATWGIGFNKICLDHMIWPSGHPFSEPNCISYLPIKIFTYQIVIRKVSCITGSDPISSSILTIQINLLGRVDSNNNIFHSEHKCWLSTNRSF